MKLISHTTHEGDEKQLVACNPHANLIVEKWKVLHHRNIVMEDTRDDRQCCLCPQMAGQR